MQKNNKKNTLRSKYSGFFILILAFFIFSILVGAAHAQLNVGVAYGENIGLTNKDPRDIVVNIIQVALGFLGIIAVILILYAGYIWMMSGGDPAKVDNAKKILRNAVVGLLIILAAWGITAFVVRFFFNAMQPGGGGGGGGGGGIPALGSGIIESHYPSRNQRDVARNTAIVVTFKEAIDPDTICQGGDGSCDPGDQILPYNIRIYLERDGDSCVAGPPASCPNNVNAVEAVSTDNKTFIFRPQNYLGSPSEKLWYYVALSDGILKVNRDRAFPGAIGGIGYSWKFEVGTHVDATPPKITSIIPQPAATEPRNLVIQVNFNEAINPLAGSGTYDPLQGLNFNNIEIQDQTAGGSVSGNYFISNQYKTIEFLTEDLCGTNSCGDDVYCLPALSTLRALVKAATLITIGQPTAAFPYDGIADMADNSLDGNSDGTAQGPQAQSGLPPYDENNPNPAAQGDSYEWTFSTNNTIDIYAPTIISINPAINAANINLNTSPQATFDKILLSSSLNSANVFLTPGPINYWISKINNNTTGQTTVKISHSVFAMSTPYTPRFSEGIRDKYQNCYYPAAGDNPIQGIFCPLPPPGTPITNPYCCNGSWMDAAGYSANCP